MLRKATVTLCFLIFFFDVVDYIKIYNYIILKNVLQRKLSRYKCSIVCRPNGLEEKGTAETVKDWSKKSFLLPKQSREIYCSSNAHEKICNFVSMKIFYNILKREKKIRHSFFPG